MRKNKRIPIFILILIIIALPLLLLGIKQTLDGRTRAATADKLEAEGGNLGGNALSKQDSTASNQSYVEFGGNIKSVNVNSISSLKTALADNSVDEIVVANGTYRISPAANQAADSLWIGSQYASRTRPITVRAQTKGGVTFDGNGVTYFGCMSFEDGAHNQTWDGFNCANGQATDTGVITFGGYAGNPAPHHITMRNISILASCTGRTATATDHAFYISQAVGGPHDLLFEDINVDGAGFLTSAFHFYHSDATNKNGWNITVKRLNVTGTSQAIMIWDSTINNLVFDTANITNPTKFAVRYEAGNNITLSNITSTSSFYSSLGANPPGITFMNNKWNQASTNPTPTTSITIDPYSPGKIYGMGISGDSLANTRLGGPYLTNIQFMRFKATQTSNLVSFKFYYLGPPETGYAGGTGGTWSAGIYNDDGSNDHLPTGSPIVPTTNIAAKAKFSGEAGRLITLTSPVPLTAGKLYHLVFTNTDTDPLNNYFSPDYWNYAAIPDRNAGSSPYPSQIHPLMPNSDWGHGYKTNNGTWVIREGYLPVLDLAYSNGTHQGWSYAEASYGGVDEIGEINGAAKMAREKVTVSGGDKIVTGAGIRIAKSNGSSPLTIKLKNSSNSTLDTITIPATNISTGSAPDYTTPLSSSDLGKHARYVYGSFSSPKTLANGSTYYLELSTSADTTYWTWVNRKLSSNPYLYHSSTYFKDGVAEYTRDGTTWAYLGRSKGDQDLQFYFKQL